MARELQVQGIGVATLASIYGTPMFVYDGAVLRAQYRALREHLHPALEIFYSVKVNPNISICALLASMGARAEVSSLAELVTVRQAGVRGEDIVFVGPGKGTDELVACIDQGIAAIVCESFGELAEIDRLARQRNRRARVALRVNPDFAVRGAGLTMAGRPRQFGIDADQLFATADLVARHPNVALIGVHAYLGTRILSEETLVENVTRVLDLAERLSAHHTFPLELVDVGGGLGVAYFANERDLDLAVLKAGLDPVIDSFVARHPHTRLVMELGRSLTAAAGTYVVTVRYTKSSMGESFAVTDGGTNHHLTAVGIGSPVKRNFPIVALTRMDEPATERWHLCGPLCTPSDTIGKDVALPPLNPGDLVGVLRSGAYGPTASPGLFLSHGFPVEVLVDGGRHYLIRARDDVDDLLRPQRLVITAGTNPVPEPSLVVPTVREGSPS